MLLSVCSCNAFGRLGYGDSTHRGGASTSIGDNLPYVDLASHVILEIQAYESTTCIRVSVPAGTPDVYCWGNGNYLGQEDGAAIGDGANEMGTNLKPTNLLNPALGITSTKKLTESPHAQTICAEMNTGALRCWGFNAYGGCGHANGGGGNYGTGAGSMGAKIPDTQLY